MNIYLAGSFRYVNEVRALAQKIRFYNYEVYCFCDEDTVAYKYSTRIRVTGVAGQCNAQTAIQHDDVKQICAANFYKLEKADVVIVALPCGKSAHLEAGWAIAKGKKVYVYGKLIVGDFDAMYCLTHGVFNEGEFDKMMNVVNGPIQEA